MIGRRTPRNKILHKKREMQEFLRLRLLKLGIQSDLFLKHFL